MQAVSFERRRFPPEFIRHTVWLYARFTLSYRDVEDLLAALGLVISCDGIDKLTRWPWPASSPWSCTKCGSTAASSAGATRPRPLITEPHWRNEDLTEKGEKPNNTRFGGS
jgi:putative transposase